MKGTELDVAHEKEKGIYWRHLVLFLGILELHEDILGHRSSMSCGERPRKGKLLSG